MSGGWIEIGSGENGHYNWKPEFSQLSEIELILNEFESEGKLSVVKEQTSYWKHSDAEPEMWALIEPFVRSEREFHDPDQPNSAIWERIFLDGTQEQKFLETANKVLLDLWELKTKYLVKSCRENDTKPVEVEGSNRHAEWKKGTDLVSQIISHLSLGTNDLECFGNFLVSKARKQIFYLSKHESYRNELPEEELAARELAKDFDLIRTYESSQPNDPWIAHFAGSRRLQVMGWRQTHSRLHHRNEDSLQTILQVREQFNARD